MVGEQSGSTFVQTAERIFLLRIYTARMRTRSVATVVRVRLEGKAE